MVGLVASSPKGWVGIGRNPDGLANTGVAAPAGVVSPSWRASGRPFLSPRRIPGETLRSSVVVVASLLGGVAWCRYSGVVELGGRSPVGAAVARLLRFSLIRHSWHLFLLCFLFLFFLGVTVLLPPQHLSLTVSWWLLCNTKRGKPFLGRRF